MPKTDLSILKKFNFERPPVCVKFLFRKPEGIKQLDKTMALCEMLREAQERDEPFYITKDNENCFGKSILGMTGGGPGLSDGGMLGIKFDIFNEPRANSRLRQFTYNMKPGDINYVVFARFEKTEFEPDLLIIMATPGQAEILLRAMTFSTGEIYESRSTCIGNCSWIYAYPFISGKVNYTVTGLSFGMKGREVFPEGWLLIAIPYQWTPTIIGNLKEMKWVLPSLSLGKEKFAAYEQEIRRKLMQESQNP
jgi:uncharacterized protein (DUF169 family)